MEPPKNGNPDLFGHDDDRVRKEWVDYLLSNDFNWNFFGTMTTEYELTLKSARRAAERFYRTLRYLTNGECKFFWVVEKYEAKDGHHLHGLIDVPERFHQKMYYTQIIGAWQMAVGTWHKKVNKYGEPIQHHSRIDLPKFKKYRSAGEYVTKYIMKDGCDYDLYCK